MHYLQAFIWAAEMQWMEFEFELIDIFLLFPLSFLQRKCEYTLSSLSSTKFQKAQANTSD